MHDAALTKIELLVSDFDGVMTDNRVLVDQNGIEAVFCNRGDGLAIGMLKKIGLDVLVLSTETNSVVTARCTKIGIECIQGSEDKLQALNQLSDQRQIPPDKIAFIGNDINDQACLEWVGIPIVPSDAAPAVKEIAFLVTKTKGGYGVLREIADWIVSAHTTIKNT